MRQSPIDLAYSASVRGFYPQFEFSGYKDTVQNATLENNGHSSKYIYSAIKQIFL